MTIFAKSVGHDTPVDNAISVIMQEEQLLMLFDVCEIDHFIQKKEII